MTAFSKQLVLKIVKSQLLRIASTVVHCQLQN